MVWGTMKLLEADHPTVLRRLVRELNSEGIDGFYVTHEGRGVRGGRARLRKGWVEVHSWDVGEGGGWIKLVGDAESVRTAQVIVASRVV